MKFRYNNTGFVIKSCAFVLAGFIALSYSKYDLNNLPLSAYRYDYIGNILNMLITLLLIIGFIGFGFNKKPIDKKRLSFISVLIIFTIIFIVLGYAVTKLGLLPKNEYVFNISLRKAVTGIFFILSAVFTIYILLYMWGIILGFEKLFELRTLSRSIFAVLLLFIFALFYVWNVNSFTEDKLGNKKFEYGLIPGAAVYSKGKPSPIFAARIRKAYELAKKNKIDKIVLTGGRAPGEITEAEAAMKYLIDLGIKPERMIVENETSATSEQIKFVKYELVSKNDSADVLIISDGFHLSRALQICKFFRLNATGVSSDYSLSFEKTIFYRTRESIALLLFWFFAI